MFGQLGGDDKNKMHPQDARNMFIFFVVAAVLYLSYDAFIQKPQLEALRQQQLASKASGVSAVQAPAEIPPRERAAALGDTPRIALDNKAIFGSIALKGGRIDDVVFHDYYDTVEHKDHVVLLSPKDTVFPRAVAYGWVAEGNIKVPGDDTAWHAKGNQKLTPGNPVTLTWDNGQGITFENTFSIDDEYLITVSQKAINHSSQAVTLRPYGLITQTGLRPEFAPVWIVHEGPIGFADTALQQATFSGIHATPMTFDASRGWAGITDKYWLTSLIPPQGEAVKYRYTYIGTPPKGREKDKGKYQVDYTGSARNIPAGGNASSETHLFTGAKKVFTLQKYGQDLGVPNFDLAVDFGWFWFMTKPFFYTLHFIAEFTPNFGVALILMTILVRSAVFPLTNISYKSFAKMKLVGPQVAELRAKMGDDKAQLQAELMKLYEREGVNPMSGCLPIFVQIPIFFSLYKTLVMTIEMRQAPFFGWIHDLSAPDPSNLFTLFGLIPWAAPAFLHVGAWPCLLMVAFMFQRKLNPPPQDPVSRDMAIYYPILMCYLMSKFASGLVVYWTFSAWIGIIQQVIIMRSLGVPIYLFDKSAVEKKIDQEVSDGPGVHPLAAMAEKEVEEMLFPDQPPVTPLKPRKKKKK